MGSKQQAESSRNYAAFMKAKGIRRKTTVCPTCYNTVGLPYVGHNCPRNGKPKRR